MLVKNQNKIITVYCAQQTPCLEKLEIDARRPGTMSGGVKDFENPTKGVYIASGYDYSAVDIYVRYIWEDGYYGISDKVLLGTFTYDAAKDAFGKITDPTANFSNGEVTLTWKSNGSSNVNDYAVWKSSLDSTEPHKVITDAKIVLLPGGDAVNGWQFSMVDKVKAEDYGKKLSYIIELKKDRPWQRSIRKTVDLTTKDTKASISLSTNYIPSTDTITVSLENVISGVTYTGEYKFFDNKGAEIAGGESFAFDTDGKCFQKTFEMSTFIRDGSTREIKFYLLANGKYINTQTLSVGADLTKYATLWSISAKQDNNDSKKINIKISGRNLDPNDVKLYYTEYGKDNDFIQIPGLIKDENSGKLTAELTLSTLETGYYRYIFHAFMEKENAYNYQDEHITEDCDIYIYAIEGAEPENWSGGESSENVSDAS